MSAKYFPKSKWSEGKYQAECPTDTKEPIRRHSMIDRPRGSDFAPKVADDNQALLGISRGWAIST